MLSDVSMLLRILITVMMGLAWQPVIAAENAGHPDSPGDPVIGKLIYDRCIGCHSLEYNRTGPLHCGLIGRQAGSVPDFQYSEAMQQTGIVWNDDSLDKFLAAPLEFIPGTSMGFIGIKNKRERQHLIAYLKQAMYSDACQPNQSGK